MKTIDLGAVKIPVTEYASQGNAFLGIRGSGKTYGATMIAEQLLQNGVPFVAFDPIGVWRNLKVAGKGPGFKVVVAHPDNGDLPLTPESAPEIVRAAMRENIPLVIDLYSMNLSKADWKRIVEQCVRLLLHENKDHGLRHIFIEEAAEFCPQRVGPDQGRVYAEIEKLARMGGNASLGYTLINQRSEEVNKAVLELCDTLFLHRQKGRNSLTALGKWLDFADAAQSKEIVKSLPLLPPGRCWLWLQGSDTPKEVQMPEKQSFHPDRQHPRPDKASTSTDVSTFVSTLKGSLQTFIEKAKENDPAALRNQIAELKRQIAGKLPAPTQIVKEQKVEVPVIRATEQSAIRHVLDECRNQQKRVDQYTNQTRLLEAVLQNSIRRMEPYITALAARLGLFTEGAEQKGDMTVRRPTAPPSRPIRVNNPQQPQLVESANGELSRGARQVLIAIAQNPDGATDHQIAVLTGYKKTSRTVFKQQLKSRGLMQEGGRGLVATVDGIACLGNDFEPLPTGKALQKHWLQTLSGGELELFKLYVANHPADVSVQEMMDATGYKKTSITVFRQRLAARNLIDGNRASENLFD